MILAGRYQLLDERGDPGRPLRARDLSTAQTVLLRPVRRLKPDAVAAALARARDVCGIFHPSLVTLFDAFEGPHEPLVLAYEFVEARSLRAVAGGQPFHARRAAEIAADIADAAAELHARGAAHGTIDSETVVITAKGRARLDRVGDPSLDGAELAGEAADVAALGRLLVELVTGRRGAAPADLPDDSVSHVAARIASGAVSSAAVAAALLRERGRLRG